MNTNFLKLIMGRISKNFGDSLLFISLTLFLFNKNPIYSLIFFIVQGCAEVTAIFTSNLISLYFRSLKQKLFGMQLIQLILLLFIFIFLSFSSNIINSILFYVLIYIFYIFNPLSYAVESTIVTELIDKKYLTQAYSIMAATGQLSDMIFNAISGVILVFMSFGQLSITTVLSFMCGVICYRLIKVKDNKKVTHTAHQKLSFKKIIYFLMKDEKNLLVITSIIANFSFAIIFVSYPLWSSEIQSGLSIEVNYGLLIASGGTGMFIGSMISPYLSKHNMFLWSFILKIIGWFLLIFLNNNIFTSCLFLIIGAIGSGIANVYIYSVLGEKNENIIIKEQRFIIVETLSTIIMPLGYIIGGIIASHLSISHILTLVSTILIFNLIIYIMMKNRKLDVNNGLL